MEHISIVIVMRDMAVLLVNELGTKVQRCWANFILNGDPNNELLGIKWPEYTLDEKKTMVINSEWQVVNEVRPKDMAIARKFQ